MKKLYVIDPRIDLDTPQVSANNIWEVKWVCFQQLLDNYWRLIDIISERTNLLWQKEYVTSIWVYDIRSFSDNPPENKVFDVIAHGVKLVTNTQHPSKPLNISEENKRKEALQTVKSYDKYRSVELDDDDSDLFDDM